MCFSMPEAFIHGLRYNATVLFVRFLNTHAMWEDAINELDEYIDQQIGEN